MYRHMVTTSEVVVNKSLDKLDELMQMPTEEWDDCHIDMVRDLMKIVHCGCDMHARLSASVRPAEKHLTAENWLAAGK